MDDVFTVGRVGELLFEFHPSPLVRGILRLDFGDFILGQAAARGRAGYCRARVREPAEC